MSINITKTENKANKKPLANVTENNNAVIKKTGNYKKQALKADEMPVNQPTIENDTRLSFETYAMTPTSGRLLWALTHAVLLLNKQFESRPYIPKGNIVNFYSSSTILRHHVKNGNFEENKDGKVRLTVQGINYFKARIDGRNASQQINQKDIDSVMEMLTGKPIKNKTRTARIMPI
jgi:hypothetical protein